MNASRLALALALTLPLALVGCGGPPDSARRAQRLLERGDYAGAQRAAEDGLAAHPKEPALWRITMRAALARGDHAGAVAQYRDWRTLRGGDDPAALRLMARTTLWQGLSVPSSAVRARAIAIVERHAVESLAQEVGALVAADDDLVAAAAAIAVLTAHPMAPQVSVQLLRSEDERARALVVRGISRRVGEHARDDLVPMLRDPSPAVRRAAVDAVAGFGDAGDTELLVAAAEDPDGQVRSRALRALARRDRGGLVDLARAHLGDDYLGARLAALALLDARAGDAAIPDLRALVERDADPLLALRAAVALYERTDDVAREALERAAASADWSVRVAALNAVSSAGPVPLALSFAGRAIRDPRAEVRLAAARVLWQHGLEARARQELVAALDAPRAEPRLEAATHLAQRGDAAALAVLSELARSPTQPIRARAIAAHRSAGAVTPGLVDALADPSIELRLDAADVLLAVLD